MNLKKQNGSISLFVLISLLFYMSFLILLYANNTNKIQTISEKIEAIKSVYSKNYNNVDEVYNWRLSKNDTQEPQINIPDTITVDTTKLSNDTEYLSEESYITYGNLGGETQYISFDTTFSTFKDFIQYVVDNEQYGACTLTVKAYGNNGLNSTKDITINVYKVDEENTNITDDSNNVSNTTNDIT